jgi:hypothetical protein
MTTITIADVPEGEISVIRDDDLISIATRLDGNAVYLYLTVEDIDALIAALREARAALVADGAGETDEDADWRKWDEELATPEGQAKLARLAREAQQPAAPEPQRAALDATRDAGREE